MRRSDFPQIETWYEEALALAHAERSLEQRFEDAKAAGFELLAITAGDDVVGLVDYRLHEPAESWQTIVYIAVARRGFGYGSEAVRALEERAETSQKITSFCAEVSPRNGLGLYFWLRAGYHPAHEGEVFWRARG